MASSSMSFFPATLRALCPSGPPVCDSCGQTAESMGLERLRRCSRCLDTSFCSKACQASAWPRHKQLCLTIEEKARKLVDEDATKPLSPDEQDAADEGGFDPVPVRDNDDDPGQHQGSADRDAHAGPGSSSSCAEAGGSCEEAEVGPGGRPRRWPPLTTQAALLALECSSYSMQKAAHLLHGIRRGRAFQVMSDERAVQTFTAMAAIATKSTPRVGKLNVEKMRELELLLGVSRRNNIARLEFAEDLSALRRTLDPACAALQDKLKTCMPQVQLCRSTGSPHSCNQQLLDHVYRTAMDPGPGQDQWRGLAFFLLLAEACLKGLQLDPAPRCPFVRRQLLDLQRPTRALVASTWEQLYRQDQQDLDQRAVQAGDDAEAVHEYRGLWLGEYVRQYKPGGFSAPGAWVPREALCSCCLHEISGGPHSPAVEGECGC